MSLSITTKKPSLVTVKIKLSTKEGLKSEFIKSKDAVLIDCYSLNKNAKERVIRNFITIQNIKVRL